MIVTIPVKEDKTVKLLVANTSLAVAATANSLTLGQIKDVDISQAEVGDVLMFKGTKWEAESLDGGTPKMSELGGSSGGNTGTATIDFGSGSNEAQVAVSGQTGILSTSRVVLTVSADATSTSHTASDHRYFLELCSLTSGTPVANTGFTIYARSVHKLTGTWTINYSWN